MKIKISKQDLLKGIQTVQNVISSRTTLPILSNILIETQKNKIKITATDLDTAISCPVPATIQDEGAITVPSKRFGDIIKELPEQDITVSARKNNMVTIDCKKTFFKVMGLPKEEFPKLPTIKDKDTLTIEQSVLSNMLNMTSFAMSHDETRYILNGVLFDIKESKLKMVATDGRRLALIEKDLGFPKQLQKSVIVPVKTVQELIKTLKDEGEVKIFFDNNQISFDIDKTLIISRLIEGEFPQYEQVIPKECREKVKLDRTSFLAAARRASILTNQDSQAIKIDLFKNRMIVSKNTPDIGEAREELGVEYKGDEISIGFNPSYLIDVLKNIDLDNIGFELTAPDKPGVIRTPDNFVYVVLPMQLG